MVLQAAGEQRVLQQLDLQPAGLVQHLQEGGMEGGMDREVRRYGIRKRGIRR